MLRSTQKLINLLFCSQSFWKHEIKSGKYSLGNTAWYSTQADHSPVPITPSHPRFKYRLSLSLPYTSYNSNKKITHNLNLYFNYISRLVRALLSNTMEKIVHEISTLQSNLSGNKQCARYQRKFKSQFSPLHPNISKGILHTALPIHSLRC